MEPMVPYVVQVQFEWSLPENLDYREEIYGSTDPARCVRLDLDTDPAAFFLDGAETVRILRVEAK